MSVRIDFFPVSWWCNIRDKRSPNFDPLQPSGINYHLVMLFGGVIVRMATWLTVEGIVTFFHPDLLHHYKGDTP